MRFLLDENADFRLFAYLEQLGYNVTAIGHEYPHGLLDERVLAIATKENRILITNDRGDFGDLIFRQRHPHYGVILFRLKADDANIQLKKERLQYVLNKYTDRLRHFLVVTQHKVRVRAIEEKAAA